MAVLKYDGTIGHVGEVVSVHHDYQQIMSDVWEPGYKVQVFDVSKNKFNTIWVNKREDAEVDVTKETLSVIEKYFRAINLSAVTKEYEALAHKITKGVEVRVVGGRLAKKGTVGKVVVELQRAYGRHYRAPIELKVGIATSDAMVEVQKYGRTFQNHRDVVWAWARNVERVTPEHINPEVIEDVTNARTKADMHKLMSIR